MASKLFNAPNVKIGIVAVSRDCFPESLFSRQKKGSGKGLYWRSMDLTRFTSARFGIVESEIHMRKALADIRENGCNALCVYLGNFGPEIAETMLAKELAVPGMFCAAAEESQNNLVGGRGDAYCGMRLIAAQSQAKRNKGIYSGISCGHCRRMCRHDQGFCSGCTCS